MTRLIRPLSWIKAARKDFEAFPVGAQDEFLLALSLVAESKHPDVAKPLKGSGSDVLQLVLKFRGNVYRVVYAVQIADDIWVLHSFQKKSRSRSKTPKTGNLPD